MLMLWCFSHGCIRLRNYIGSGSEVYMAQTVDYSLHHLSTQSLYDDSLCHSGPKNVVLSRGMSKFLNECTREFTQYTLQK